MAPSPAVHSRTKLGGILRVNCPQSAPTAVFSAPCLGGSVFSRASGLPSLMATIVKRERQGGTVYLVDIRIHGFPRQKKTFKRLTDAKLCAQQTEAAIRRGEFHDVVSTARRKTVKDVIDRYRQDVLPHKAPSTQRADATYLAFWERSLGKSALSNPTSSAGYSEIWASPVTTAENRLVALRLSLSEGRFAQSD